jgi:hypothetical protein
MGGLRLGLALIAALVPLLAGGDQGSPVYIASPEPTAGASCSGPRVQVSASSPAKVWACVGGVWTNTTPTGGGGGGSGLPADPAACAAGKYVIDQDINGVLTCAQVQWSQLGGVPTLLALSGSAGTIQTNGTSDLGSYGGTSCAYAVKSLDGTGAATCTSAPTIPIPGGTGTEIQVRATATTFGAYAGSGTCAASNWMTALDLAGAKTCARPAFTDLSGSLTLGQMPTGTGYLKAAGSTPTYNATVPWGDLSSVPSTFAPTAHALFGSSHSDVDTAAASTGDFARYDGAVWRHTAIGSGDVPSLDTSKITTGTFADGFLASAYSGAGACGAHTWASTLTRNAAPTCTQPAFSDVSGTLGAGQAGALFGGSHSDVDTAAVTGGDIVVRNSGNTQWTHQATGTANQVLHGGTNIVAWSAVDLSADTAATVLPMTKGGTGANLTGNTGGVPYFSSSTVTTQTAGGAQGSVLYNSSANTPAWLTVGAAGTVMVGSATVPKYLAAGAVGTIMTGAGAADPVWLTAGTANQALYSGGSGAVVAWRDANRLIRLTSDYTNATTSMTNTALTWTSPASVSRSGFSCTLMVMASSTTTGGQFDVTSSVAPTTITYQLTWYTAAAATATNTATANSTALGPTTTAPLTTYTIWTLQGIIVHTSSSSTVTVRAKAAASGTLTVGSGSYCDYYVL